MTKPSSLLPESTVPLLHLPSWVVVVVAAKVEVVVEIVVEVVVKVVVEDSLHASPVQPSKQRQTSGSTHCP